MATTNNPTGWWMYHGDPEHSGVASGSPITSKNVGTLKVLHDLHLGGPVLSVPAVTNGYVYVGLANSASSPGNNGGLLCKINLATGKTDASFRWDINPDERDSHGFTGMGCTPAVVDGKVIFSSFNGVIYCLNEADMTLLWATNLRYPDPAQNQWADNFTNGTSGAPLAEGWSSPLVVNGKVYVGFGEGENPQLFGWVYCLDENTGKVVWLYCTVPFNPGTPNPPNVIPPAAAFAVGAPPGSTANPPPPFSVAPQNPPPVGGASWAGGCSVWSGIAYDADLKRIYATTGNPQPDSALPSPPLSNGLLSLDADTGEYKGFFQALPESSYRVSDIDVDVGGSPIVFKRSDGVKVVCFGCKNGGFFLVDADTMNVIAWRTLLPSVDITNGKVSAQLQIPSIDPHVPGSNVQINPHVSNAMSNVTPAENFMGTYSTPAVDPAGQRIFIGVGGKNYDTVSPGIDFATTPFMRAFDWNTLKDVWPTAATPISDDVRAMLDGEIPDGYTATLTKYTSCVPPMYTNPGEAALSSPAVVNDVVFCSTSNVSIYAFNTVDGTPLWSDDLGSQTDGFTGGYGYCLGPAIYENYVVAGALVAGGDGGVLRIYQLGSC
jgi:outer membrane protein assembly factor BamB